MKVVNVDIYNHKESLTKQLTSKLLSNSERNRIEEDLIFFESMITDRVTTFGKKDIRLERKRKISNEKNAKAKQTDQMPSSSSSLVNFSSFRKKFRIVPIKLKMEHKSYKNAYDETLKD